MDKKMKKAKVAYVEVEGCTPAEACRGEVPAVTGFQEIYCSLIFDVKMDFTRKA